MMTDYAICPGCNQVRATREIPHGTGDIRMIRRHRCDGTKEALGRFTGIDEWWPTRVAAELVKATRAAQGDDNG